MLGDFFEALCASGEDVQFHPHPLTRDYASYLSRYRGLDLYYVVENGSRVLAYGMLRGWDEGFAVPSLGLAVHPESRRFGLGLTLMHFLHSAARCRGASQVILKVYRGNLAARRLYERLGYQFSELDGDQLKGSFSLG